MTIAGSAAGAARAWLFGWCALALVFGGCAAALERKEVSTRFKTLFGCGVNRVSPEPGGYRVEGCGKVAHFRCFDVYDDFDARNDRDPLPFGEILGDVDTCILEHTEGNDAAIARADARPAIVTKRDEQEVAVKTRILIAGGHLRVYGQPVRYPEQALLTLHSIADFAPADACKASLYLDGNEVPIEQLQRAGDHEMRMLVPVASLVAAHQAVRFAGSVCGREFELDQKGREALGLFAAHFREQAARHGKLAQGSGGETSPAP